MFRVLGFALAAVIALAAQTSATVADRIRVAVQRTGTLALLSRAHPLIDDGAMLNAADSFDFDLLARDHFQRLHAR